MRATLLASVVGLTVCGAASQAHATAYAFSNLIFTNLSLTGITQQNTTGASILVRDSAGYPGAAAASNVGLPNSTSAPLTAGADVVQATSGPGPFPAENTFGQALTNSFGARGDAVLTGNLLTGVGTGASDVSEGRLAIPGSASSTAGTSTGFSVNVSVTTGTTFTLTFNASDMLTSSITAPGEFASAQVNASFSVAGINGTTFATQTYSPDSLNTSVTSTQVGSATTITNASSPYSFTVNLNPGNYQFSLLSGAQEQVAAPVPTSVPEPITLSLLGSGLVIAGAVGRRRR